MERMIDSFWRYSNRGAGKDISLAGIVLRCGRNTEVYMGFHHFHGFNLTMQVRILKLVNLHSLIF